MATLGWNRSQPASILPGEEQTSVKPKAYTAGLLFRIETNFSEDLLRQLFYTGMFFDELWKLELTYVEPRTENSGDSTS